MAERYTTSEAVAWEFVLNASSRGMTATSALQEYRAGGGHIRNQDWYFLFRATQDAAYSRELSSRLPDYFTVNKDAYQWTPVGFEMPYVAKVKVTARDSEGNVYASFWRTIERTTNTTRAGWEQQAVAYLQQDKTIPDIQEVDIEEMEFFTTEAWGVGAPGG